MQRPLVHGRQEAVLRLAAGGFAGGFAGGTFRMRQSWPRASFLKWGPWARAW